MGCAIESPLVSVVIVTYNSSRFVLETLESAKVQTYKKIELIVADDCSQDDTVEKCQRWIEIHAGRFVRTEILTSEKNTGIAANINRGFEAAYAEWIKPCAGDDVLKADAVEKMVKFMLLHNDASLIHGMAETIDSIGQIINVPKKREKNIPYPTFDEQMRGNAINSSTVFYNKADLFEVGGFNTKYAVDDYYIFLKLLDSGKRIYYCDEVIAQYRIHDNNFSLDRFTLVKDVLEIQLEFRNSRNFFRNHYIFCRNTLINNFYTINKNSLTLTLHTIKINPYTLFAFVDFWFWYPVLKHYLKKMLKRLMRMKKRIARTKSLNS